MINMIRQLSDELGLRPAQVESAVRLIDEGNTIPFIARYRKEATGALDDIQLRSLSERLSYLRSLEKRKEEVTEAVRALEKLTPELEAEIASAETLARVEDLYRPFKQKRRTRASIAREKGLEPLALLFLEQAGAALPEALAAPFVDPEKGVPTAADAVAGAGDIIAERISDDAGVRGELRELMLRSSMLRTASEETEGVYAMYCDYAEPVAKIPGHRVLAIDRGEREGVLKVTLETEREAELSVLRRRVLKKGFSPSIDVVKEAAEDALDRLIRPSLEREVRNTLTERAQEQAIRVFALNLRPLLMQPPVKGKVALGLDPAYRTGCKIAVVDATGRVLDTAVVYPTPPQNKTEEAKAKLRALIEKHHVSVIAIGNGTASKESEIFVAGLIRELDRPVSYLMVSEAGASVYSASKLASEEFPQYDVSLRSAVSIARRLQDPLAELVKIDPKAIGVGQYQHDMPPNRLGTALGGVVEDCVNTVGVDLNTASFSLLSYVAGIGNALAKNIVAYREENGHFSSRKQLLKVPKLGKKAFEQAAGFLRIPESENPFDNTAVHPESYSAAKRLLELFELSEEDVRKGAVDGLAARLEIYGIERAAEELGIGVPTLRDMAEELSKPGRDPRDNLPPPVLRTDVMSMEDLKPGMVFEGTVRNVVDFGAFVDIGVHQDGLVHISRICDRFIRHPSETVRVGDLVKVRVLEVDQKRKRISLTMREVSESE